jgi:hypothetical protein
MTEKYTLHSKGENWVHFRLYPDRTLESFTVSFIWDGTCVLTGDYGMLGWKRVYYPKPESRDFGFPDEGTNIDYFAQKCCMEDERLRIYEWNKELAIQEFKELSKDDEDQTAARECLERLELLEDYDEIKMHEILQDYCVDAWEWKLGKRFTSQFVFQFELLKSVSRQIREALCPAIVQKAEENA